MSRNNSKYLKFIHAIGDFLLLNYSLFLGLFFLTEDFSFFELKNKSTFILIYNVSWFVAILFSYPYHLFRVSRYSTILKNLVRTIALHFLIVIAITAFTKKNELSLHYLCFSAINSLIILPLWRLIVLTLLKVYRKTGHNYRNVIIAGADDLSFELKTFFKTHPEHGYRLLGMFSDNYSANSTLGNIKDIQKFAIERNIDEIYCSLNELSTEQIRTLIHFSDNNLIRIKFIPRAKGFNFHKIKVDFYDHLPLIILRPLPLDDPFNRLLKRSFDIVFSMGVIVFILSWLYPLLGLLIKIDSRGPIIFKQKRSGLNNKIFTCYKFRTMKQNKEAHTKQATKDDPRITKLGVFLRRSSIDEFPQFFNVFIGNMSVVGPRPHMLKHTKEYSKIVDKFMVRHFIKPGITGLSQTRGLRGETRDSNQMNQRVKMDIFYLEHWTFLFDLKIIFNTVYNGIMGEEDAF